MNAEVPIHARIEYRPLPFDIEAEQALLGTLIRDPRKYWQIADRNMLAAEHFYDPLHQRLFTAIATIIPRDETISTVSLNSAMRGDEGFEQVGGIEYLEGLAFSCPAGLSVKAVAKTIRDIAARRALLKLGEDLADACMGEGATEVRDTETIINDVTARMREIADHASIHHPVIVDEAVQRAVEASEAARTNKSVAVVSTGIKSLDDALGGLMIGDVTTLGAPPNTGKSALAAGIMLHAARTGDACYFSSAEMPAQDIGTRFLAMQTGIPSDLIRKGWVREDQVQMLAEATLAFRGLPLLIDEDKSPSVGRICMRATAAREKFGKLRLIVVDHLRFMEPDRPDKNELAEIQQITKGLTDLAKTMRVAILLIAHLNRDYMKRGTWRPQNSDLYGSSAIEQNSDSIWFLHREELQLQANKPPEHDPKFIDWQAACERARNKADVYSTKVRMGRTGTVTLGFDGPRTSFFDLDQEGALL